MYSDMPELDPPTGNYIYKVILCYFTFIFDLELMTLEKRKMRE